MHSQAATAATATWVFMTACTGCMRIN